MVMPIIEDLSVTLDKNKYAIKSMKKIWLCVTLNC